MLLWIPSVGDYITLTKDWTAEVPYEDRNKAFIGGKQLVDGKCFVVFPAGTVLKVERIYIRKGKHHFDSVTFKTDSGRFWVKLASARNIDFEIGVVKKEKRFTLWNRYQDSGWEKIEDCEFDNCNDAIARAAELSKNAIIYGMIEVRDNEKAPHVVLTFPAGGMRP